MGIKGATIGFDGKRAAQNRTGLGNYSRFVISGLSRFADAGALKVFTPSAKKTHCLDGIDKMGGVEMEYPHGLWSGALKQAWRVFGICGDLKRLGVDIYHGLSNELPIGIERSGVASVVTIHDLIFLRHPECYHSIDRKIYDYKFRRACGASDRVIAVSECTKRDITEFYGTDPDKIDVVYQGCDEQFWHVADETTRQEARTKFGLPEHYILYVGSIERRKNLGLIAEALPLLPKDVKVIAVGRRTAYADEVERITASNGTRDRMTMLSGVPFRLLPALYQMSDLFVYPSRYEGFGIPLLEALVSRVPVIGCTGSCLEEAGGVGSIYVSPDDAEGLAREISRVLCDDELRQKMIADGVRHAERFRQEGLTRELTSVYEKVLGLSRG